MIKTYIFGHKNPDCDTTCAPKVLEWYLKQKNIEAKAVVFGKINNESKWVFENFKVDPPEQVDSIPGGSNVYIVDTTEPGQLPENIENLEIIEIWDHHKLGGLSTSKPLKATIDTVGCTCTLLFEKFKREKVEMPKPMAGLILSSIISDTLNLTSPTTTEQDRDAVEELAEYLGINLDQHAKDQFNAKSSIEGMSAEEIVNFDAKEINMGGKKVKIGVFETVDASKVLAKKDEIKKFILENSKGYDYFFYFIVDVLKGFAVPIITSEAQKKVLEEAFKQSISDDTKLEGVVSRKKQIVPRIEKVVAKE